MKIQFFRPAHIQRGRERPAGAAGAAWIIAASGCSTRPANRRDFDLGHSGRDQERLFRAIFGFARFRHGFGGRARAEAEQRGSHHQ
jgi:hypothetical protein